MRVHSIQLDGSRAAVELDGPDGRRHRIYLNRGIAWEFEQLESMDLLPGRSPRWLAQLLGRVAAGEEVILPADCPEEDGR